MTRKFYQQYPTQTEMEGDGGTSWVHFELRLLTAASWCLDTREAAQQVTFAQWNWIHEELDAWFDSIALSSFQLKQSVPCCTWCKTIASKEPVKWFVLFILRIYFFGTSLYFFWNQHQTISCFDVVLVMEGCLLWWKMIMRHKMWYVHMNIYMRINMLHINSLRQASPFV